MYKVATVLNNIVIHIGEYSMIPVFSPPILVIDITDHEGEVKEGFTYDVENNEFTEAENPTQEPEPEPETQPTIEEIQTQTLLNTEYLVIMSELTNL